MRRLFAFVLMVSLSSLAPAIASAQAPGSASLAGMVGGSKGSSAANQTVRLRSVADGKLVGTTTSDAAGGFSFTGLDAGNYTVEVVNAAGEIVATSAAVTVAPGAAVTGLVIGAPAAGALNAAALASKPFFASTAGIVTAIAGAAAVAGVTVAATSGTASPSK
jgi:hypothetical protein